MRDLCHSSQAPTSARASRGFTLIELMVALVVAGILAAVAYPAYQSYVMKSRRGDARATISTMVQAQERYRSNNASYSGDAGVLLGGATADSATSFNGYYTVTVSAATASGYQIHAVPVSSKSQHNDADCQDIYVSVSGGNFFYRDARTGETAGAVSPCWPQ
ncbi:type IV pilin protein [Pelomonas sp. KK5]|uniref:type IV pilin protein n=1 Tax=Pelomonas sp. KK5 TaxID=1855730 RepID=UPI00097C1296|nr:type IV pilin protein [Pelomonas sp. KK5]